MYQELTAMGYRGGYGRVAAFARRFQAEFTLHGSGRAFVPLKFQLGEAFQFDWSTEYAFVGGLRRRLDLAHTKLCASRAFWLTAYPTQSHEMLFDAHARAFAAFGGVPIRGIYDNMKTAVDKVGRGKARTINARFEAMSSHYLFEPEFCNVASGWQTRHRREECPGPAPPDLARSHGNPLERSYRAQRLARPTMPQGMVGDQASRMAGTDRGRIAARRIAETDALSETL